MLKKKILSMLLVGAMILSMTGCGSSVSAKANANEKEETQESGSVEQENVEDVQITEEQQTKLVTDHAGREVEIPAEINRIVMGSVYPMPSVLTTYLGSAEKIVGIHPVSMSAAQNGLLGEIYPELLNAETGYLNGDEINVEEVLKLHPDIAIGVTKDQAEVLSAAGIPAIVVSPSAWEYDVLVTYNEWVKLLDQIFGESEVTHKVATYSEEIYQEIQQKVAEINKEERKKVLVVFQYDENVLLTSGKHFFGQYWADAVGAENVASQIEDMGSVQINMEQVYEWNPDVILITNFTSAQPQDLYENAIGNDDWSNVAAIKNKQVYKMPLGIYRTFTPGVDTPVTLQWVAKTVYPEVFSDKDINQITRDYFEELFGVLLTDEQVDMMYHPAREGAKGF